MLQVMHLTLSKQRARVLIPEIPSSHLTEKTTSSYPLMFSLYQYEDCNLFTSSIFLSPYVYH